MYNHSSTFGGPAKKMVHRFAADEREWKSARGPEIFLHFLLKRTVEECNVVISNGKQKMHKL